jgi:hypothetical protein
LSYVEDTGIDAAAFWQNLYYDKYPVSYEETRETNQADFLLSGLFAADFVTADRSAFLANKGYGQGPLAKLAIWEVLAKKIRAGRASVNHHRAKLPEYVKLCENVLQHPMLKSKKGFKSSGDAPPLASKNYMAVRKPQVHHLRH